MTRYRGVHGYGPMLVPVAIRFALGPFRFQDVQLKKAEAEIAMAAVSERLRKPVLRMFVGPK